jgi:hypothetical protein
MKWQKLYMAEYQVTRAIIAFAIKTIVTVFIVLKEMALM